MRNFVLTAIAVALGISAVGAQQAENMPNQVTNIRLGDVRVRFLNFKWDEEAFEALEEGDAKRSWAIARLFPNKPIIWDGRRISGGNLLILNPASGDTPMTWEVRVVNMREVWVNPNFVAEPPEGETIYTTTADFKKVTDVAERLELALSDADGKIQLAIHYGNRLATLAFDR